ncbi:MAG TPA: ABC transporter ATP-binding protein [Anaerolineae bacterium]|nr:ABC transporter ATP-binding protein [Anaerolineae bacterium]HQK15307.1 ABC transporter ATP-binding protein [Anaerolineae bacterium]
MSTPLLELKNVTKIFGTKKEYTVALEDMTFAIQENFPKIVTIAGESGSGKTTMGMLMLGFYSPTFGSVLYRGQPLAELDRDTRFKYRREIQAVFQDPFAVYNPFYKVDNLLSIPIKNFKLARSKSEAHELMEEALERVGLRPEETLGRYPHQLSGGQRQRIAVARALLLKPKLLITDEPVSMVDASLRSTILKALRGLNRDFGVPLFYITHDLTTAYHISDFIIILYHGSVMEVGNVDTIIRNPQHPYTKLLVSSIPWPNPDLPWGGTEDMIQKSQVAFKKITGCKFAPRCPYRFDLCETKAPDLFMIEQDRAASCYLYRDNEVLKREELSRVFVEA